MDKIRIEELCLFCVIGVNPEERGILQEVNIDIEIESDLDDACAQDDISATVDYKTLKEDVQAFVETSSYQLLEALAEGIAQRCLQYENVSAVRIVVNKPGALRKARNVAVEIERDAESACI